MSNAEQYEMLCTILCKLVDVLNCDELSLLAHCCGVQIADFTSQMNSRGSRHEKYRNRICKGTTRLCARA